MLSSYGVVPSFDIDPHISAGTGFGQQLSSFTNVLRGAQQQTKGHGPASFSAVGDDTVHTTNELACSALMVPQRINPSPKSTTHHGKSELLKKRLMLSVRIALSAPDVRGD